MASCDLIQSLGWSGNILIQLQRWWQANRGEEGKKGQHIFENVNLNNVFWVSWREKKPLSNAIWLQWHAAFCHFSPTPKGIVWIFWKSWVDFSVVSVWVIFRTCTSVCYDCMEYNSSHYFSGTTCPHLAFRRLLNDLEVMTLQCSLHTHTHVAQFSLLHKLLFN